MAAAAAVEVTAPSAERGPAMIQLLSSDNVVVHAERPVAEVSGTILNLLSDAGDVGGGDLPAIPLAGITGDILQLALDFSADYVAGTADSWKAKLSAADQVTLFGLMLGANFLENRPLLDMTCQHMADMITSLPSADEMRKKFNIINDFEPQDEARIAKDLSWLERSGQA
jgi:S-phase kinase-associated protein 1